MKTRLSSNRMIALPILVLWLFAAEWSLAATGKEVFEAQKCSGCHSLTQSQDASFQAQLKKKGPDLWYAGSKYQKAWLVSYLQSPKTVRPLAFNSVDKNSELKHPALSAADAGTVGEYLSSLTSKDVTQGVVKKANKGIRGKILFKKKQACYGCHRVAKRGGGETGGFSGPSLVGAGQRLQGDWIFSFLKNPASFVPAGRMPNYKHLNKLEIKTISEYVMSF